MASEASYSVIDCCWRQLLYRRWILRPAALRQRLLFVSYSTLGTSEASYCYVGGSRVQSGRSYAGSRLRWLEMKMIRKFIEKSSISLEGSFLNIIVESAKPKCLLLRTLFIITDRLRLNQQLRRTIEVEWNWFKPPAHIRLECVRRWNPRGY